MQYRIEFLNEASSMVGEVYAEATSRTKAFLLVVEKDWPPDALTACAVDMQGRRGRSVSRPQGKSRLQGPKRVWR